MITKAPNLNRDRVVMTAFRIAREAGLSAASMRRIGRELDVSTMAAYRHIRSREHLINLMLDAMLAEVAENHRHRDSAGDGTLSDLLIETSRALGAYGGLEQHLTDGVLKLAVLDGPDERTSVPGVAAWLAEVRALVPDERLSIVLWAVRGAAADGDHVALDWIAGQLDREGWQ